MHAQGEFAPWTRQREQDRAHAHACAHARPFRELVLTLHTTKTMDANEASDRGGRQDRAGHASGPERSPLDMVLTCLCMILPV